jgi:hypothetical protein
MCVDNINSSSFSKTQYLYTNHNKIIHPVLRGMFEGGIAQNGLSNEHDEFLDVASLLLIKTHKDKTILPIIIDMIFFRNRKGLFTHDLIWAFFQAKDPYSLMLIANYLGSEDINDVKLARKLLDFVPSIDMTLEKSSHKQYKAFFYWLEENYPFLHFTGESFQRTSKPKPYIVALDSKYLCKQISLYSAIPLIPYTEKEKDLLCYFNDLTESNKLLLSTFSFRIHSRNVYLWEVWINHSIIKQISIAEAWLCDLQHDN